MAALPKKIDFLAKIPLCEGIAAPLALSTDIGSHIFYLGEESWGSSVSSPGSPLPPSSPPVIGSHTFFWGSSAWGTATWGSSAPVSPLSPSPPPFVLPPSPPFIGLTCTDGSPLILEPRKFSSDSFGWFGGLEEIADPLVSIPEEYVASDIINSVLGVEFPLPLNPSPAIDDSGVLISAKYVNATDASLSLVIQYFDSDDNLWHNQALATLTLTSTYELIYFSNALFSLPSSPSIIKLRIAITVLTLDAITPPAEVRINHLTIPYCSVVVVSPPLPPLPLIEPVQPPDVIGTLPPFIEEESELPPLLPPPPIFVPPLPPGSEILRPNRDILVRLWQPRPAFMQLNDPLDFRNPIDAAVPLYGPATVDTFDESTGNYLGTIRPRVEVGFTAPITEGPWDALQLRFRAARSRPPQPETPAPPLPIPATKALATYPCPSAQTLIPRATDFPGIWQLPPLEKELTASVDSPSNTCFISAPVEVPSGAPGQIALTQSQINWDAGYNQVSVRLIARARSNVSGITDNSISGVEAYIIQFNQIHAGLPPGAPEYQVKWDPFGCSNQIQVSRISSKEIFGTGILQTNIDIHAEFFLTSQDSDNLIVQVSLDGINYYGEVIFDLGAFQSLVIYYRIALNKGGLFTPHGNIAVGAGLMITGPPVVTGVDLIYYPQDSLQPFIVGVVQNTNSVLNLVSQCRVGVSLHGNMELNQAPIQYTDILISDWSTHPLVLTWDGFWSENNIKDLRIRLSAEALLLGDDVPFIDISAMDVIISAYCPGLSQPLSQPLIKLNQVDILPVADVFVTGWTPVPAWLTLFDNPALVSRSEVLADPRTNNQLLVQMAEPDELPEVMVGYVREWITIEVIVQARVITLSSLSVNLLVSTIFGQEQESSPLTMDQAVYFLTWNYDPGLTTDQINRLKIAFIANSLGDGGEIQDSVEVALSALTARLTFQDVLTNPPVLPPPPPIPVDSIITVVESNPEIFSCGSLGDCSIPQGRIVAKVTVTNPDIVSSTVNFIVGGRAKIRISDSMDTVYSLSQTIAGSASITFFIYGWVGDQTDPFPVDPADGEIIISLVYSVGVHKIIVGWYYIGW
jgi:hypothetical protein